MGLLTSLKGVSTAAGAEQSKPAKPERRGLLRHLSWSLTKGPKDLPARPEGVQVEISEAGGGEAASALGQLLRRAVGCDDTLRLLDLSKPALGFARMSTDKQLASLGVLTKARAVQAVWLPGLKLSDTHAAALATLLLEHRALQALCLEGNFLSELGLLQIAAAASGHPSLSELRVEQQRRPLSTAAAARLLDAMEATPTLTHLDLGVLRDDTLAMRLSELGQKNSAHVRKARQGAATAAAGGELDAWRRQLAKSDAATTRERVQLPKRELAVSDTLKERAALVGGVVGRATDLTGMHPAGMPRAGREVTLVPSAVGGAAAAAAMVAGKAGKAERVDWVAEAARLAAGEAGLYGWRRDGAENVYVLTGSLLWGRATEDERRGVLAAFSSATCDRYDTLQLANAFVSDALAVLAAVRVAHATPFLKSRSRCRMDVVTPSRLTVLHMYMQSRREFRSLCSTYGGARTSLGRTVGVPYVPRTVSSPANGSAGYPPQVADALLTNSSLTSLNIESNAISSVGLEAVAEALRSNTSLRELKVGRSQ